MRPGEPAGADAAAHDDPLAALLAGRFVDPETGARLGTDVRAVVIEPDLRGREADLVAALGLGPRVALVDDAHTHAALGARVARALAARFAVEVVTLGGAVHADAATVEALEARVAPGVDAIVAVGAGTINDLCKMVARRRGVPQAVFATAPSMNGYASVSASIAEGGLKRSYRAAAPVGVFVDLAVLAAAPPRLIRAGLGDSLCRATAQVDWLLAHRLLGQPYLAAPFALLADDEAALLADPGGLLAGDLGALRALARTLVLSGCGMTLAGGSFPASQGEHLLAHHLELRGAAGAAYHGEQIGVTTLAMAALQEALLRRERPPVLGPTSLAEAEVRAHFGPALGEACWRELAPKRLDAARAEALSARLAASWDPLREELLAAGAPAARLRASLRAAGAPTTPAELGWTSGATAEAWRFARAVRNRYTFLDLAGDLRDGPLPGWPGA